MVITPSASITTVTGIDVARSAADTSPSKSANCADVVDELLGVDCILADVDADEPDLVAASQVDLLEIGDLRPARGTPGRPQVHDGRALDVGERRTLARRQRGEVDIGQSVAVGWGGDRLRGTVHLGAGVRLGRAAAARGQRERSAHGGGDPTHHGAVSATFTVTVTSSAFAKSSVSSNSSPIASGATSSGSITW